MKWWMRPDPRFLVALLALAAPGCGDDPAVTTDVPVADADDDAATDVADQDTPVVPRDVPSDAPPDAVMDAAPDVALDVALDVVTDASPDVALDAAADTSPDVALDVATDASPDVAMDAAMDAPPDVAMDAPPDVGRDAAMDAAPDVVTDAAPGGDVPGSTRRAVEVAAGSDHTCARLADGTVRCWGQNDQGQLGIGSTTASYEPVPVPGLSGVIQLGAGTDFTCALLGDRTVHCWGDGGQLQLGRVPNIDATSPQPVMGLSGVTRIAVAGTAVCALRMDGTVSCWGDNANRQLGLGGTATTDSATPTPVVGLTGVTALAAGLDHFCARRMDGTVSCWGDNDNGQLGLNTSSTTDVGSATAVMGLADAVELVAGQNHTCARRAGGTVQCWGLNSSGQLGDGTTTTRRAPVEVPGLAGVTALGAAWTTTCAVAADGVRCWGNNLEGELGNDTLPTDSTSPVLTRPLPVGTVQLDGGENHVCAVGADGSLRCWGRGDDGQLGMSPRRVTALSAVAGLGGRVLGGARAPLFRGHTCARLMGDTLACWGSNDNGQVGDGTLKNRPVPSALPGLAGVRAVTAGTNHTCALLAGGTVQCWGDGLDGALGTGDTTDRLTPTPVMGLSGATAVEAADDANCAIVTGGAVQCWGDNDNGQLGNGGTTDAPTAAAVPGLGGVVELAGGANHFCARLMDGTVRCWGDNLSGQLGNGTTTDSATPTPPIPGLSGVVQVVAGERHTCARLMDGTVRCWGENNYGSLGVGTMTDSPTPTPVPGVTNVAQLASGYNYVCARLTSGAVRCWGYNEEGNLGDGTVVNALSPVTMAGATGVGDLLTGNSATCVVAASDGSLRCVGFVGHGQLGNGLSLRWATPALVPL